MSGPEASPEGTRSAGLKSRPGTGDSRSSGGGLSGGTRAEMSVSVFSLGAHHFALETALVGELVVVESLRRVPLAPPAILGIFSLRGSPVALVDLAALLELPGREATPPDARNALVLKTDRVLGAISIDRVEAVLPLRRGQFTPRGPDETNEMVGGMLTVEIKQALTATMLDSSAFLSRFAKLKYV